MAITNKHSVLNVRSSIRVIRQQRIILDADLARFYGVTTKRLNEAVKRNRDRFPEDFACQLTEQENKIYHNELFDNESQSATASSQSLRSQSATSNKQRGGRRYRPYAFTEHGVIMIATILKSKRAIEMSVFVVRAFVCIREQLAASTALAKRLAEIEKTLLTHDQALIDLYEQIRPLLQPPPDSPRKTIGFSVRERGVRYNIHNDR